MPLFTGNADRFAQEFIGIFGALVIGTGSFGNVVRICRQSDGMAVAVKMPRAWRRGASDQLNQTLAAKEEFAIGLLLEDAPHVLQTLAIFRQTEGPPAIVMELADFSTEEQLGWAATITPSRRT